MVVASNPFTVLGIPARFSLEHRELERLQRDAFVARNHDGAERLEAINEAYRVLKAPVTRAELLFELRGWSTKTGSNPALLERVFAEREAIERAKSRGDATFLSDWVSAARKRRTALCVSLGQILDGDASLDSEAQAASVLDELRFVARALTAAELAQAAIEDTLTSL